MKKADSLLFILTIFAGCSPDEEPLLKDRVMERVYQNAFVLDDALAETAQIVSAQGDLEVFVGTQNSQTTFISLMNTLTQDVVLDVVDSHDWNAQFENHALEWSATASHQLSLQNYLAQIALGTYGPNADISLAVDLYAEEINQRLQSGHSEQILIESFSYGGSSSPSSLPMEQFSLNFTKITMIKNEIDDLIMTHADPEELDNAIEDFINENPETEVLIGLLLPAVQKVRESNNSGYQVFSDVCFGNQTAQERAVWNQHMRRVAFLSGLDFILSQDFNNTNENYASVPLQAAMHHGVSVLAWARIHQSY